MTLLVKNLSNASFVEIFKIDDAGTALSRFASEADEKDVLQILLMTKDKIVANRIELQAIFLARSWLSIRTGDLFAEISGAAQNMDRRGNIHNLVPNSKRSFNTASQLLKFIQGWISVPRIVPQINSNIADADTRLATELEISEGMRNYNEWLVDLLIVNGHTHILEVGAGRGVLSAVICSKAKFESMTLSEPSMDAQSFLKLRFKDDQRIRVVEANDLSKSPTQYNLLIASNVLEHIQNEVATLTQWRKMLNPGGKISIIVPAHNFLYGKFDASIGHIRRYSKSHLRRALQAAGFVDISIRYLNPLGAFAWFFAVRLNLLGNETAGSRQIYDNWLVPLIRLIDRSIPSPFGQSLFATASRS